MRRRNSATTGLEAAPDIMLLTMAALMVAIVWLVAHADETTLPPVDLPTSDAAALGASDRASAHVTLRADGEVWLEDRRLAGGVDELEAELRRRDVAGVTLRADAGTSWQHALGAMSAVARLGLPLSVAAQGAAP